jgi:vacuolar-type H+-ATPase subunit C/Vma6
MKQQVRTMENVKRIIATTGQVYSKKEATKLFKKYVSAENLSMLLDHICTKDLAEYIMAFFEDDGILMLDLGGEYVAVKRNENKVA